MTLLWNRCTWWPVSLGGDVRKTIFAANHKLVGGVVNVHIVREDLNRICVAKDLGHLLQGDSLSLRKEEEHEDRAAAADDDEDLRQVSEIINGRKPQNNSPDRTSSQCWRMPWPLLAGKRDR